MKRVGICKLCLELRELRDSHLLPKAGYRVVSKSQEGQAPIVIKPNVSISKDEHVRAYVFCEVCEQIFSKNGEAWVLQNSYRGEGKFSLRSILDKAEPVYQQGQNLKVFAGRQIPEIDTRKLVFFAASVFWKSSVHKWKSAAYELKLPKLGKRYNEEFRKYLLGLAEFPKNATIWLSVIGEERLWGSFFFPYGGKENGYWRNHFQFLGLAFDLFIGGLVTKELKQFCLAHSPDQYIAISQAADEMIATHSRKLAAKSKPVGSLATKPMLSVIHTDRCGS